MDNIEREREELECLDVALDYSTWELRIGSIGLGFFILFFKQLISPSLDKTEFIKLTCGG